MNFLQNRNRLTDTENKLMVTKGERVGRDKLGVWDQQIQNTTYKINNKVLLYSTGNYIQYLVINHNGKEYLKKNVYIAITESLCCTAEISTTL